MFDKEELGWIEQHKALVNNGWSLELYNLAEKWGAENEKYYFSTKLVLALFNLENYPNLDIHFRPIKITADADRFEVTVWINQNGSIIRLFLSQPELIAGRPYVRDEVLVNQIFEKVIEWYEDCVPKELFEKLVKCKVEWDG